MDSALISTIQQIIDWEQVKTRKGHTQISERYYISKIKEAITLLGGTIDNEAPTQRAVDIRGVHWPDGTITSYECKKINTHTGRFMLNDTFLKPDIKYIFLYADIKQIRISSGPDLIAESIPETPSSSHKVHIKKIANILVDMYDKDNMSHSNISELFSEVLMLIKVCVLNKFITYYQFGELFKQTVKFGMFCSRPRPNWNVKVPYKPPVQSVEVPHSQAEQSVP